MSKAKSKKPVVKKAQKPSKIRSPEKNSKKTAIKALKKLPIKIKALAKPEKIQIPEKKAAKVEIKPILEKALKKSQKAIEAIVDEVKSPDADSRGEAEIVLTDADGRRYCRVQDCDQISVVEAYCRYHYLLHWKRIQYRKKILNDNKLHKYIDELTAKYPDKFLEVIRKDLANIKTFTMAIQEMEIDDSDPDTSQEQDDAKSYIDEVRGVGGEAAESTDDDF
ncbi:MAG: hypothetical protein SGJ18_07455 [Pseudomonadota bacterium]|nr:hypothetical protein [Pseudomonadota bacterium]